MVSWAYYFNNVTRFVHHADDYGSDDIVCNAVQSSLSRHLNGIHQFSIHANLII